MFFVDRYEEDDYSTLLLSFLTTFSSFVGEPAKAQNWLDILFGIVIVIVLLNVVIAIVSREWDDATREATKIFWQYRLDFLQEISRCLRKEAETDASTRLDKLDPDGQYTDEDMNTFLPVLGDEEENSKEIPLFFAIVSRILFEENEIAFKKDWENGDAPLWTYLVHRLIYAFWFLAGLVSFGLLWPVVIRRRVFEAAIPQSRSNEIKKNILEKVDKLEKKSSEELEEMQAKMHQSNEIKKNILEKVDKLEKKSSEELKEMRAEMHRMGQNIDVLLDMMSKLVDSKA
jgi:hypothetical protein